MTLSADSFLTLEVSLHGQAARSCIIKLTIVSGLIAGEAVAIITCVTIVWARFAGIIFLIAIKPR